MYDDGREGFYLELMPAKYPQHAEFVKQIEVLENIGAAQFPGFQRSTEKSQYGMVRFKLAQNRKYGLVFDQNAQPVPVSEWSRKTISGMAEITVMLSGVTKYDWLPNRGRTGSSEARFYYYRFARIQLLDRQKALQYLTRNGEERGLLRVQYFGKT